MAVQVVAGGGVLSSPANAFTLSATSACTVAAWIRIDTTAPWTQRTSITGVYGPGGTPVTAVQLGVISPNLFGVWTWGGSTLVSAAGFGTPVGTWNHFVYTYDGVNTNRLFINGVLNSTNTVAQQAGNLTQTFINGYPTGGTNESGATSVDDFVVFNRQLTANEILTIINAEGPRDGIASGVIARYAYEEGAIGSSVAAGVSYQGTGANMTQAAGGTAPIYVSSLVMSNLRQVQG